MIMFAVFGVVLLVENNDKPRKPVRHSSDAKSDDGRNSAQSAVRRDRAPSASHSTAEAKPRQGSTHQGRDSRPGQPQGSGYQSRQGQTGNYQSRQGSGGQYHASGNRSQGYPSRQGSTSGYSSRSTDGQSRSGSGHHSQGYSQSRSGQAEGHSSRTGPLSSGRPGQARGYQGRPGSSAKASGPQTQKTIYAGQGDALKVDDGELGLSEADAKEDSVVAKVRLPKKAETTYTSSYRGSSQKNTARSSPNRQSKKNAGGRSNKEAFKKQPMLNTHRIAPFKYDMNEILSQSSMDPNMASGFLASVIAKASRISTKEAKDYARNFLDEGNLTKDEYDKVCRLLDRYSKFR